MHKNVIEMFVRCTVYEIGLCHFCVDQTFCYVVCEHLHRLKQESWYMTNYATEESLVILKVREKVIHLMKWVKGQIMSECIYKIIDFLKYHPKIW